MQRCSFCNMGKHEADLLVQAPVLAVYICDHCVAESVKTLLANKPAHRRKLLAIVEGTKV